MYVFIRMYYLYNVINYGLIHITYKNIVNKYIKM